MSSEEGERSISRVRDRSRSYSRKHKKRSNRSIDRDHKRHKHRDVNSSNSRYSSNSRDDHHRRHRRNDKHSKRRDRSKSKDKKRKTSEDRDRRHKSKKKKHSRSKSHDHKKKKHKNKDRRRSKSRTNSRDERKKKEKDKEKNKEKKEKKNAKENIDKLQIAKQESLDDDWNEEAADQLAAAFLEAQEEDADKALEERRKRREELMKKAQEEADAKAAEIAAATSFQKHQENTAIVFEETQKPGQNDNNQNQNDVQGKIIDENENVSVPQNGNNAQQEQILDENQNEENKVSNDETNNVNNGKIPEEEESKDQVAEKKEEQNDDDIKKENFDRMIDHIRQQMEQEADANEERDRHMREKLERKKAKKLEEKAKAQEFDMFVETPEDNIADKFVPLNRNDQNEYKDDEGYYRIQIGEIINERYQVTEKLGRGAFGNVVKAVNVDTKEEVALKIIKNKDIYIMSGLKEKDILTTLNESDKHNKRHIIRLIDTFDHKKHLILVFELMEMDLRQVLKTFGKSVGLSMESVRSYARQLFISLFHLKKQRIIHADLKPDNILVCNNKKTLKLADFGSAFPIEENQITSYLISRYYRPPEIILGMPYEYAIDTWSAGCTIFELYTGKFLFPGKTNNDMIKLFMQTKGRFSNKVLRKGKFTDKYFDKQNNFLSLEIDPVTKQEYVKAVPVGGKLTRDFQTILKTDIDLTEEDKKKEIHLRDFLEKCLTLDPNKRLTPDEALKHPFINFDINKFAVDSKQMKNAF